MNGKILLGLISIFVRSGECKYQELRRASQMNSTTCIRSGKYLRLDAYGGENLFR